MSRSRHPGCPNGRGCGTCLDAGENARARHLTREHGEIDLADGLEEALADPWDREYGTGPGCFCGACWDCDPDLMPLGPAVPLSVPLADLWRVR